MLSISYYLAVALCVVLVCCAVVLTVARVVYLALLPRRRFHPPTDLERQVVQDVAFDVEEQYVEVRGRTLFRRIYKPKVASCENPQHQHNTPIVGVVVFMHGIGSDGLAALRKHVTTLVNHGMAVVAPDFYGHGRSDGPHEFFRPAELVEDLKVHIEHIKTFPGLHDLPIFLFGVSLGGHVALQYARKHGSDIAGLALLSPAVALDKKTVPPLPVIAVARFLRCFFPELPLVSFNDAGWNDVDAQSKYKKYPLIYYGRLRVGTGLGVMESVAELEPHLRDISTPFLVVHGRQDRVCAIDGSLMLYERSLATDKELIIYEHCNHVLLWEPHGRDQRIMLDVTRWIRRRCAHADRVAHPAHCGCHLNDSISHPMSPTSPQWNDRTSGGIISDDYVPSESSPVSRSHSPVSASCSTDSAASSSSCSSDDLSRAAPNFARKLSEAGTSLTRRARDIECVAKSLSPASAGPKRVRSVLSPLTLSPTASAGKIGSEQCACCGPLTCSAVVACPPMPDTAHPVS